MSDIKLGPWPAGIDNVSPRTDLTSDDKGRRISVLDAVNVDFDRVGAAERRDGFVKLSSTGAHSVYRDLCMVGSVLSRYSVNGGAATITPLIDTGSAAAASYCQLNGTTVFSNMGMIGTVTSAGAFQLGIPEPAAIAASAGSSGGLYAGRYGLVVTHVNGEESAASSLYTVDVAEGGGIVLSGLSHALPLRVYRTGANGDVLYRCAEIPVGMSTFLIGHGQSGRVCDTRNMVRTMPGHIVRPYNGYLLVARGRTIYFTQPMRYGLMDPRHDFIQRAKRITMIAPVQSGVFVGDADGVQFYRGDTPGTMRIDDTSSPPPIPGTDAEIPSNILSGNYKTGNNFAVWLASRGYVIGSADGTVTEPQANRIRLQAVVGGIAVNDRRIISIVKEE